jgi:hypothetical protein
MFSLQIFGVENIKYAQGRVNKMREGFTGAPSTIIRRAGDVALEYLREEIPVSENPVNIVGGEEVEHEHARDRLEFHVRGGDTGSFEGPYYLKYVIEGTDDIEGNPFLAFQPTPGGDVLVRTMVHGQESNDFRKRAWTNARSEVQAVMRSVGMKIVKGESLE